jgi:hypothetical protein
MEERAGTRGLHKNQIRHRGDEQEAGLQRQPVERRQGGKLFDQPVECKRNRQYQCNPGQLTKLNREIGDTDAGDTDRQPLGRPQPCPQDDQPKQNTEQRVDKVTQAGFDDVPGIDGPYIGKPIDSDQEGGNEVNTKCAQRERATELAPLPNHQNHCDQQEKGPGDAMSNELQRRNIM